MNRMEAYRLLTCHLRRLAGEFPAAFDAEVSHVGTDGCLYAMTFEIEHSHARRYLKGTIHNNNSAKFELVEERVSLPIS